MLRIRADTIATLAGDENRRLIFPKSLSITDEQWKQIGPFKEMVVLSPSGWKEMVRNVPDATSDTEVVSVSMNRKRGPILVLAGLKFRGNIGTIVRAAVQANAFEKIVLIDERETRVMETPCASKKWEGGKTGSATMEDIYYYSMFNGPLIPILRFDTVDDFLATVDPTRPFVAIELGDKSINLYSKQALDVLKTVGDDMYLVIGAEDCGVPSLLVSKTKYMFEIPSMSASINVSCAFMACLSTYLIARNL